MVHGEHPTSHVPDVDRDMQGVQYPVERRRRRHETRVDGAPDRSPEWVPSPVVEPIQKIQKAFGGQELRRSEVEVRIEFVDHRFIAHLHARGVIVQKRNTAFRR